MGRILGPCDEHDGQPDGGADMGWTRVTRHEAAAALGGRRQSRGKRPEPPLPHEVLGSGQGLLQLKPDGDLAGAGQDEDLDAAVEQLAGELAVGVGGP